MIRRRAGRAAFNGGSRSRRKSVATPFAGSAATGFLLAPLLENLAGGVASFRWPRLDLMITGMLNFLFLRLV
jgi:hypothetical protein